MSKIIEAVNWNILDDDITKMFWEQNIRQFWIESEIPLSDDKIVWMNLTEKEQETFKNVLVGLTLLDTEQGSSGMPKIAEKIPSLQSKAVLSFMGFMEHMHAKSYSSIFSTLCTAQEIEELFASVTKNELLQTKVSKILSYYNNITDDKSLYLAMVSSVFLETFLFYSGFYYPLYLSGQGKMVNSGEIINLIIRDESIHGVYVGLLAQKIFKSLSIKEQQEVHQETHDLLIFLYNNELKYTKFLYDEINLTESVNRFIEYNADKALMNLGLEPHFNIQEEDINSIVLNGLNTETKNHDFFSTKGNGYIKTLNVDTLTDDDFNY